MENKTQTLEEGDQIKLDGFLNEIVVVSVKDGRKFRGKLTQYDQHMNMLLEGAEDISNAESTAKYKLILLKGGNVSSVSV